MGGSSDSRPNIQLECCLLGLPDQVLQPVDFSDPSKIKKMDIFSEIQDRLETKKFEKVQKSFDGGCISSGYCYETDDGKIFVKLCKDSIALDMFNGEKVSLDRIGETRTIHVPKAYFFIADPQTDGGALVLEYLDLKAVQDWRKFGSNLADLHLFNPVLRKKKQRLESWIGKPPVSNVPFDSEFKIEKEIKLSIPEDVVADVEVVEQFGFETTTCCGRLPQNNEWHHDWIEFYARYRLKPQIDLVIEKYRDRQIIEYWSQLQLKIDRFFQEISKPIEPCLLHGDLWSGNIGQTDNQPVIFDPASFYGHSEYELSIAKLFGGFDSAFFQEYFKKIPKEKGFTRRQQLYILFHLLNHWNHFGGAYKNQSKEQMKKLSQYDF